MKMWFRRGVMVVGLAANLAACAGRGGGWPSLMTKEEARTGKASDVADTPITPSVPTDVVSTPATSLPAPAPADTAAKALIRAQTTRLDEARRDAAYIAERWQKQQNILADAVATIKVKGPADSYWNKAQLELTRLNQIAAEWDDLETMVNQITGQLAVAAHQGGDIRAILAGAGSQLTAIEAAKQAAARTRDDLRKRISR